MVTSLRPDAEAWSASIDSYSHFTHLENLLYLTCKFAAADPRDKVYGLVGIAKGVENVALVTPDYSLPVEQVFENAARAVLSLPPERRSINILGLAGTGFSDLRRDMPSWVPSFGEERLSCPYADVVMKEPDFKASGSLPQNLELEDENNCLIVKAISIDQIVDISEFGVLDWGLRNNDLADVYRIARIIHGFVRGAMDLCRKHAESPSAADKMISERLWLSLITGRIERKTIHDSSNKTKFEEAFQHWLQFIKVMSEAGDLAHFLQRVEQGALGNNVDYNDGTVYIFSSAVQEGCIGRSFAITSSGRLCVVPPLTRVGDSVIIPLGAQNPFLIRQRPSHSKNGEHELVGEAWVEGVMQGEMIGVTDAELIRIT